MAELPKPLHTLTNYIDKHHEEKRQDFRAHLGFSQVGEKCDRKIWLNFRWVRKPKFSGRVLRLFRRGHLEEKQVVADLRAVGLQLHHTEDEQLRWHLGGHIAGSPDGIIESGVPEAPAKRHILEIKTYSSKRFAELQKNGVKESAPTYYAQTQINMLASQSSSWPADRVLFFAVCKDDDKIYTERIYFDHDFAKAVHQRAHQISLEERLPLGISDKPTWFECKWCDHWEQCHGHGMAEQINCRTCAHSTPHAQGDCAWSCAAHGGLPLSEERQRVGCRSHTWHPDLVPWELDSSKSTEKDAYYIVCGDGSLNGESGISSWDLLKKFTEWRN